MLEFFLEFFIWASIIILGYAMMGAFTAGWFKVIAGHRDGRDWPPSEIQGAFWFLSIPLFLGYIILTPIITRMAYLGGESAKNLKLVIG